MTAAKSDIIAQLRKSILPLQGYRITANEAALDLGIGPMKNAFPSDTFPLGAVHEFICSNTESASATVGFISGLLKGLIQKGSASIWVSSSSIIYPPALAFFNIDPASIIFINVQKEKDILWTIEEALKCEGLAAVIADINELSFTASRRLQLAVEQSGVTGFILRHRPHHLTTTASIAKWKITPLPGELHDDMPGVGFPRWNAELLKIRNGKPGSWQIEWVNGKFRHISTDVPLYMLDQKKTG